MLKIVTEIVPTQSVIDLCKSSFLSAGTEFSASAREIDWSVCNRDRLKQLASTVRAIVSLLLDLVPYDITIN